VHDGGLLDNYEEDDDDYNDTVHDGGLLEEPKENQVVNPRDLTTLLDQTAHIEDDHAESDGEEDEAEETPDRNADAVGGLLLPLLFLGLD
jgi:hypothetical protein